MFDESGPPQNHGRSRIADSGSKYIPLWDSDNPSATPPQVGTNSGVQVDLEITDLDTYKFTMTPLDNPGAAYTQTGMLDTPGEPIDWLEVTFFNTITAEGYETDFFIKSIEIIGPAAALPGDFNTDGKVDAADFVVWRKRLGSTDDYNVWRTNFGRSSATASSNGLSSARLFRNRPAC